MRSKAAKTAYDKARYAQVRDAKIASARAWQQNNKAAKSAYDVERRPTKNARRRADYASNPAKYLNDLKQHSRRRTLLRVYGLTLDNYEALLASQGHRCACCGTTSERWCVDHDHKSGLVRGIVCGLCNTGIGHLGDTLTGLETAANYLRRHHGLAFETVDEHF